MRALPLLGLLLAALAPGARAEKFCLIVMPQHASALGALLELEERVATANCQRGDLLAITGDVHLKLLARACDFGRPVLTEPPRDPTGRPHGAVCVFAGLREHRPNAAAVAATPAPAAPPSVAHPSGVAEALAIQAGKVTPTSDATLAPPPRPAPRPRVAEAPPLPPQPTGLPHPAATRN